MSDLLDDDDLRPLDLSLGIKMMFLINFRFGLRVYNLHLSSFIWFLSEFKFLISFKCMLPLFTISFRSLDFLKQNITKTTKYHSINWVVVSTWYRFVAHRRDASFEEVSFYRNRQTRLFTSFFQLGADLGLFPQIYLIISGFPSFFFIPAAF